ncbi:MAG TPA: S8 family serine peptidase [Candidatus Saccharimonadales bacterium]|nr:S8 family serine peptidase [Candidatus Saccharimonadales bacterium]
MIEKIKSYITRINTRNPIFIAVVFSLFFLFLILIVLQSRVQQGRENNTAQVIPTITPTPPLIPGKDFVQGQINVKFKEGLTDAQINSILSKYNARIKSTISGINVKVIEVPIGQEDVVRKRLIIDGIVKYADFDHIMHAQFAPNDTNFGNQWGLANTGKEYWYQPKGAPRINSVGIPGDDIHAQAAWEVTKGTNIKVAVLDSGIDMDQPDLAGKVILQKVFITSSIDDKVGHGTHVAGIVSANTNNGQGVAGVCPECQLIIGKAMDDSGSGTDAILAEGITWASDNGAKVINMSVGIQSFSQTLQDAVNYAWNKGSVLVAAAGNCGGSNYPDEGCASQNPVIYPAGLMHVVSVAATDNKDQKASFSESGTWVNIAAPGITILSTLPTHSYAIQSDKGSALNYDYLSGTSQASPMVAGVAALIWSTPYGTSNQAVVDRLFSTADQITGTGTYWQKGRVNAAAAVGASSSATLTPTVTVGPTDIATPTATMTPTTVPSQPIPSFVCAGSPNSVCNPTLTPGATGNPTINPTLTGQPNPTIGISVAPSTSPSGTPGTTPEPCPSSGGGFIENLLRLIRDFITKLFQQLGLTKTPVIPCNVGGNQTTIPTGTPLPNLQLPKIASPSGSLNLTPTATASSSGFQNITLPSSGNSNGSAGGLN